MTTSTVGYSQLSEKYIPLGILVAVFSVIAISLVQYTKRIRKVGAYLKSNFLIFKNNNILTTIATIVYYLLLITPVALLIAWISLLGSKTGANPAIPILLSFLFTLCLVLPVPGRFFYYKVLAGFLLFVAAQLVTMGLCWNNQSSSAFFTLTAILLSVNGSFFSFALFLWDGTTWTLPDNISTTNFDKIHSTIQIWRQKNDPPKIIDGGLYHYICTRPTLQIILTIVFYLLSLVTLMTYSLVGYYHSGYGTIALANSVCIITTDVILTMVIFISKKAKISSTTNALAAMGLRGCLVGFTGDYWFLGYCFLYLILGIYLSMLIINKYYPNSEKLPSMAVQKRNILTMPQLPALVLQLMFAGSIFYVGADNGKTLKTDSFLMDGTTYSFYVIGIAFMILQFAIFFYLISLRIVQRSKNRIRSINFYYMGCQSCSEYYFFIFFAYGLLVILGFYMFTYTKNSFIWNSCVFLPLFYQAFVLFYSNWEDNDFLLLGSVTEYNKKLQKRKEKFQKLNKLKASAINKINFKIQDLSQDNNEIKINKNLQEQKSLKQQNLHPQTTKINLLDGAQIESNFMVEDYKGKTYEEWRDTYGLVQAFRQDKLLPSDKKIIITCFVMLASLVGYSIVFTLTEHKATAIIVSVEIVFLFLTFIPMKRYFATLQRPNLAQIISFVLGMILNYAFGIVSYVLEWNRSDLWTIWWAVINIFLLSLYAALALLRDKGLNIVTYIACAISVLLLVAAGVIIIVLFGGIALGIVLIGIAVYYGYCLGLYLVYLVKNKSFPQFLHFITIAIIAATSFAVMIYGFISSEFDDFYGFTITYLVINFLIVVYGAFSLYNDFIDRFQRPNFYSPYGTPIFKYDPSVSSAKTNTGSLGFWLGGWLMFYGYTLLMEIFISDTNYGISSASIFFVVMLLTFLYFTTYNVYRAGGLKQSINEKVIEQSWQEVLLIHSQNGHTNVNIDTLKKQLQTYQNKANNGQNSQQINPSDNSKQALGKNPKEQTDIDYVINDLEEKIQKAEQNEEILLVNLWTRIMLKCETLRKKKMLRFINFIKQDAEILSQIGVAIVINDELLDIQFVYNQALQQYNMLSAFQKIQFDKKFNAYVERKVKNQQNSEQLDKKNIEAQKKREQDLKKKLFQDDVDDSNKPVEQMKDSPIKMKKLLQSLKQPYIDSTFDASSKFLPENARSQCKQWARPSKEYILVDENTAMSVRQGYIGDCYLISAIGVLDSTKIKKILGVDEWKNAEGSFMVKFKKYGKDVYVIIDNRFPSAGGDEWLFGRCQNKKEIFTNILEKAYAKLYGGYQNIVGGKVSIALADMTGGFPQEIKLTKYQQQNSAELFTNMLAFKKAGYLMGAGSPQNPQGDTVDVDGIVQGHAYLVIDVKDLDGNKLIKLRNPHGNGGRESSLDWSDSSPKWTKRLLNLVGQSMADDGAFWISIDDFVFSFKSLYICRIFDQKIWQRVGPVEGQWKGKTAAGLPTKKFPAAQMSQNPHYGIKVSKRATLFIELSQNQKDEQRRGKNYIFFMVQKNNGMRVTSNAANKLCGTSGSPVNSTSVSGQIELVAESYPYTFSLLVSAYEQGCEGSYNLTLYCDDKNMQVVQI